VVLSAQDPDLLLNRRGNYGLLAGMVALSASLALALPPVKHIGESKADAVCACIDAITGSRVMFYSGFGGRFAALQCNPKQDRAQLIAGIEAQGFHVITNDGWILLVPNEFYEEGQWPFRVFWRSLQVQIEIEPSPDSPQQISGEALKALKSALPAQARLIPVLATDGSLQEPAAVVSMRYQLYAFQKAPEKSVFVAILRQGEFEPYGRVIYGEILGNQINVQWDSPIVEVNSANVSFQDINGDGDDEIIIQSRAAVDAHGGGWDVLTIFDHLGREITRQPDCKWMRNDAQLALAQACPIAGSSVELRIKDHSAVIEAQGAPRQGDAIYVLRQGVFVISQSHLKQRYSRPSH
jgi:hypothetical protein